MRWEDSKMLMQHEFTHVRGMCTFMYVSLTISNIVILNMSRKRHHNQKWWHSTAKRKKTYLLNITKSIINEKVHKLQRITSGHFLSANKFIKLQIVTHCYCPMDMRIAPRILSHYSMKTNMVHKDHTTYWNFLITTTNSR